MVCFDCNAVMCFILDGRSLSSQSCLFLGRKYLSWLFLVFCLMLCAEATLPSSHEPRRFGKLAFLSSTLSVGFLKSPALSCNVSLSGHQSVFFSDLCSTKFGDVLAFVRNWHPCNLTIFCVLFLIHCSLCHRVVCLI